MTTSDTSYYILYEFYTLYIHGNIHDNLESGVDAVGKKNLLFFDNGQCYTWHLHYRHINVDILVHWASYFISGFSNKHRPISSTSLEIYFLDNFLFSADYEVWGHRRKCR